MEFDKSFSISDLKAVYVFIPILGVSKLNMLQYNKSLISKAN